MEVRLFSAASHTFTRLSSLAPPPRRRGGSALPPLRTAPLHVCHDERSEASALSSHCDDARAPLSSFETTADTPHPQGWVAIKMDSRAPRPRSPSAADVARIRVEGRHIARVVILTEGGIAAGA